MLAKFLSLVLFPRLEVRIHSVTSSEIVRTQQKQKLFERAESSVNGDSNEQSVAQLAPNLPPWFPIQFTPKPQHENEGENDSGK